MQDSYKCPAYAASFRCSHPRQDIIKSSCYLAYHAAESRPFLILFLAISTSPLRACLNDTAVNRPRMSFAIVMNPQRIPAPADGRNPAGKSIATEVAALAANGGGMAAGARHRTIQAVKKHGAADGDARNSRNSPPDLSGDARSVTRAVAASLLNPLSLGPRSRLEPAAYCVSKIPGGTSLRLAMVHDVLNERYLRHGNAWYARRNADARQIMADEPPAPSTVPSEKYLSAMDDLAVGLEQIGQYDEAIALMQKNSPCSAPRRMRRQPDPIRLSTPPNIANLKSTKSICNGSSPRKTSRRFSIISTQPGQSRHDHPASPAAQRPRRG